MSDEGIHNREGTMRGGVPLIGPDAERRKRIIELIQGFLEDKISLAELKGISREKLFLLAEAGYVKFKHGRVDEAEKIYQALIVLDHKNAYYHSVMGAIHQKKQRPVEAILEYTRALSIDKSDVSCHVNRGEIYLRHGNFRKAAEDFRTAIVIDKIGNNMWANRARSLVIALKRSLEAKKNNEFLKRPERKAITPVDHAARDVARNPRSGTPTPPTPTKAVPRKK